MSSVFLCAINARYNHTNLAIRSIASYAKSNLKNENASKIHLFEWSINQNVGDIVRECFLYAKKLNAKAPIFMFAVYLWNAEITYKVACALKNVFENSIFVLGGPEVTYQAEKIFAQCDAVDVIVQGEGEVTVTELIQLYFSKKMQNEFFSEISTIAGLTFKNKYEKNKIISTGNRENIKDLNIIPFVYKDFAQNETKDLIDCIVYYESSRGCPFSCAYCLSSVDKNVRYLPLNRVLEEIQFFLDNNFRLIKFVDRTFNLNKERFLEIWRYIILHHNGITSFHFEIEARTLCDEAFEVLKNAKPGMIQFEIGVQSSNKETLSLVNRSTDLDLIVKNILQIPSNIHVHLDLIAGLPKENLESFGKSFDFVANLKPQQLQCGFLKVLSGSPINSIVQNPGWKYLPYPPYEVLQTPELSFDDICTLKGVEHLTELFYNSRTFSTIMDAITEIDSLFDFFLSFALFLSQKETLFVAKKVVDLFKDIFDFINLRYTEKKDILIDLLRFDFIRQAKTSNFPDWYVRRYDKQKHAKALYDHTNVQSTRESYAYSDYDEFCINPIEFSFSSSVERKCTTSILFIFAPKKKANVKNYTTEQKTQFIVL